MIVYHIKMRGRVKKALDRAVANVFILSLTGVVGLTGVVAVGRAEGAPVKLILSSHSGREVNLTEAEAKAGAALEDLCTIVSGDRCQPGRESSIPGGFAYPNGVAVAPDGDVYVADTVNNRVQELAATGEFILMFGKEVNETTKGDICTEHEIEISSVKCKAGVAGTAAGQLSDPYSVAVDPSSGDVYVQDAANYRVQALTASGEFVWMVGKEVNETEDNVTPSASEAEKNLCTAASGDVCKSGAQSATGSTEHGAFKFTSSGDLLAVGGPEHLLYVGDERRVQELKADGTWVGEISLTSISSEPGSKVAALTVDNSCSLHNPVLTESTTPTCKEFDPEYGDVYLAYPIDTNVLRKLNSKGEPIAEFPVTPSEPNATIGIATLALDSHGHLAVGALEKVGNEFSRWFGSLNEAGTGHRITEFTGSGPGGIGFGAGGELYAAASFNFIVGTGQEVLSYKPVPVAELLTSPVTCKAGADHETSATFDCALHGEVNPYGVQGTEVWFEWDKICSSKTSKKGVPPGNTLVPVEAMIESLRPNEAFCYRLAGYDENVQPPEQLTSEKASFTTPLVPPRIVGEPNVSFVKSSSAVMFGELNPQNARTEYFFEYGQGKALTDCLLGMRKESCPGVATTAVAKSSCPEVNRETHCAYWKLGVTLEATGLQPGTPYRYRLFAEDENTRKTEKLASPGPEGEFMTAPAPVPRVVTGAFSAVGATSATISGTVDPDGLPATYTFELGVYNGASTQYGIVLSGPAGASNVPVEERLALTGLHPGTTYAYRIAVSSGYVKNESHTLRGAPVTFTTEGLPEVLPVPAVLARLPIPNIAFPKTAAKCKPGYARDKRGKCAKSKRKKGKKARKTNLHGKQRHGKGARGMTR